MLLFCFVRTPTVKASVGLQNELVTFIEWVGDKLCKGKNIQFIGSPPENKDKLVSIRLEGMHVNYYGPGPSLQPSRLHSLPKAL